MEESRQLLRSDENSDGQVKEPLV